MIDNLPERATDDGEPPEPEPVRQKVRTETPCAPKFPADASVKSNVSGRKPLFRT